jgi:hypothetical protein
MKNDSLLFDMEFRCGRMQLSVQNATKLMYNFEMRRDDSCG